MTERTVARSAVGARRLDARSPFALLAGLAAAGAVAGLVVAPRAAVAQSGPSTAATCAVPPTPAAPGTWHEPLGRRITLRLSAASLPEALEQVARAAGVRLTYSGDNLPDVDCAPFSLSLRDVPLGQALEALLGHGTLEAVAAGEGHVVLAPARVSVSRPVVPATDSVEPAPAFLLDPVIVRVDVRGPEERSSPVGVEVITGDELRRQGVTSWTDALNGSVPGVWTWQTPAGGLAASFGSVRGASSFGAQAPKVYLDGIELANPLVAARLSPESIERIEVIRGPEGSALYGAGAIAGVTNIVTRHARGDEDAPRVRVRSSFGLVGSDFQGGSALAQDHAVGLTLGTESRSAVLGVSASEAPEVVPGGTARHLGLDGSLRIVGENTLINGTLRLSDERAGLPTSPLLAAVAPEGGSPAIPGTELGLFRYTAGLTATLHDRGAWTHSLVTGVDGYGLDGLEDDPRLLHSLADSALYAAGSGATRASLRLNSSRTLGLGDGVESHLTLALEQSVLFRRDSPWEASAAVAAPGLQRPVPGLFRPAGTARGPEDPGAGTAVPVMPSRIWDTGLSGRLVTSFFDRLFVTGGVRLERNAGGALTSRVAVLPTLGASLVAVERGPLEIKLRTAYGRAIRWPELPSALTSGALGQPRDFWGMRTGGGLGWLSVGPEEQSGIEAGVDLSVGGTLDLSVTRFDQTSTGFVAAGAPVDGGGLGGTPWTPGARRPFPAQSVGTIANRGWEMQASTHRGPLSLSGTLSLVDSRVSTLGLTYQGDLAPGDRMLGVPARTLGLDAVWSARRWSASLGVARAFDWIGYDRVRLARDHAAAEGGIPSVGLREYWLPYDGFTHLRLGGSRALGDDVTLLFSVDNLLDRQVGEPDNATVVAGRTLTLGVSAGLPWWK